MAGLSNKSVSMQGLFAFFISQSLDLVAIAIGWNYYKKSLSLPVSRQNISRFFGGHNDDTEVIVP
jgi:hypothetical protein